MEQLKDWLQKIEAFINTELLLSFNPKTTIVCASTGGIDFVGYRHRATHKKVRKDSIKRIKRTIKRYERGETTKESLQKSICSWAGHAGHADSYHLREKIIALADRTIKERETQERSTAA